LKKTRERVTQKRWVEESESLSNEDEKRQLRTKLDGGNHSKEKKHGKREWEKTSGEPKVCCLKTNPQRGVHRNRVTAGGGQRVKTEGKKKGTGNGVYDIN